MFTQLLSLSTGQGSFYLSTGANSYMLILGHKKESMHKIVYITDPLRWGSWYFYNCNSIPFIGKWVLLTLMHWKCEKPTYAPQTAFKSVFCSSFPHLLCRVAVTSTQPNQALSAAFFSGPGHRQRRAPPSVTPCWVVVVTVSNPGQGGEAAQRARFSFTCRCLWHTTQGMRKPEEGWHMTQACGSACIDHLPLRRL